MDTIRHHFRSLLPLVSWCVNSWRLSSVRIARRFVAIGATVDAIAIVDGVWAVFIAVASVGIAYGVWVIAVAI